MNYKLLFDKHLHQITQKQSHNRKLVNNSLFFLLLFSIIFNISAAKILFWHFDPAEWDIYDDPEVAQKIRCDYWIKKSLEANNYTYTYHYDTTIATLPSSIDIDEYDVILVTLGFFKC